MKCTLCNSDLTAGKCNLPIWGVPTVSRLGLKAHWFCSEEHGNKWIKEHPEYSLFFGKVIDEINSVPIG